MYQFPIGVMLESFRTDVPTALEKAAAMGAKGVQIYSSHGDLTPDKLKGGKEKEFLDMVKSHGLVISALCGDLGHGFGDEKKNPELIEKSKRILELAKQLETNVVTTHIGVVPEDPAHPRYQIMQDACGRLAEYADSMQAHFAIETGPETSATLKKFLDGLHSKGVAVNMDPANLMMVHQEDSVQAVRNLKDYIVHTHAKDGRNLAPCDPEKVYSVVIDETTTPEEAFQSAPFIELPLGEGGVPFPAYLAALEEIGYRGFLTIERECGENPAGDIQKAVSFLRETMSR